MTVHAKIKGNTGKGQAPKATKQAASANGSPIDRVIELLKAMGVTACGYTYQERAGHHKDAHYLRVNRATDALLMAEAMLPYAVTKKVHWELMRELASLKIARGRVMPDGRMARGGIPKEPCSFREFQIAAEIKSMNYREKPGDRQKAVA